MTINSKDPIKSALSYDPIAQTFKVLPTMAPDADGMFLSSINLFFESKDPLLGCTVDIRACENGVPTRTVLPDSKVHLEPEHIATSSDASAPTRVIFPGAVYLKVGETYAIAVKPDGAYPTLQIWMAINGRQDVQYNTTINENWGDGAFFASASGAWLPKLDRDLKFDVFRSNFATSAVGNITQVNRDYEFLTLTGGAGVWQTNEEVYKVPSAFSNGTVTLVAGNSTVTGVGTAFDSSFAAGQTVVVRSSGNNAISDVVKIATIESATSMTIDGAPQIGISDGNVAFTPCGSVDEIEQAGEIIRLKNSTAANTSHRFEAGDSIKGCLSGATATIDTVDNKVLSYFKPHFYKTTVGATFIESHLTYRKSTDIANTATKRIIYGADNSIRQFEAAIFSKSNEANTTGIQKSLSVVHTLKTTNPAVTPVFDARKGLSTFQNYTNIISANTLNEKSYQIGSANTKYTSRIVNLAPGMDADDLNVYLTGYKPGTPDGAAGQAISTDFQVYARIGAAADPDSPTKRQWTLLTETDTQKAVKSSVVSGRDFKELVYNLPQSPTCDSTTQISGTASTVASQSNVVCSSAGVASNFAAGDIVIVKQADGLREDYAMGRVASVSSATLILANPLEAGKDFTSGNIYKVAADEVRSAFRYPLGGSDGGYRLVYFNSEGSEFNDLSSFQIKVVMLADQTNVVPRLADIRAIALSG